MPQPASVALRGAVRVVLADLPPGALVLVACSGGADSLALAAATAWVAERAGLRAGAVIVDHGLLADSGAVAHAAAAQCRDLGLDPVEVHTVTVTGSGAGPEAAARIARYAALDDAASALGAPVVLLGHTSDDQAEQVLLGLARGSGTRSLAGIPPARGRFRRPLLGHGRPVTEASCAELGLIPWCDPHNADPRFLRVRVRHALTLLEEDLGPGLVAGLVRSATHARADADHLDALAAAAHESLGPPPWPVTALATLPLAIRGRVWRAGLIAAGAPAGALGTRHTDACDRLLTDWHGQGPVHVPGPLSVTRRGDLVVIANLAAVN